MHVYTTISQCKIVVSICSLSGDFVQGYCYSEAKIAYSALSRTSFCGAIRGVTSNSPQAMWYRTSCKPCTSHPTACNQQYEPYSPNHQP